MLGLSARVEVRTLAAIPDTGTLETALDMAARAPSAQNSQPWLWRIARDGVHLYADRSRRLGDTDADHRDVLLSCGAVLDHCVVALAALGWRARIRRFPDGSDTNHLALIEVIEQPSPAASVELAAAIPHRRADRRPYTGVSMPAGTLELLYVRAARRDVMLGVVPAQRWDRRDEDGVVLRYRAAAGRDSARDADGVLVTLGTEADDDLSRLRAGETMSRVLLAATAMGLVSCPLTDPLRNSRDRLALACEVFDGDAYPQVLIRLGSAAPDPNPLPGIERRSVADTTTWDQDIRRAGA